MVLPSFQSSTLGQTSSSAFLLFLSFIDFPAGFYLVTQTHSLVIPKRKRGQFRPSPWKLRTSSRSLNESRMSDVCCCGARRLATRAQSRGTRQSPARNFHYFSACLCFSTAPSSPCRVQLILSATEKLKNNLEVPGRGGGGANEQIASTEINTQQVGKLL